MNIPLSMCRRTADASGVGSRFGFALLAGALLLVPSPAAGQERIAILTEPGTPVVATEILLSVGPADEPADKAGIAYLASRSLVAPIQPALDSLGARIAVTPQKDALSFSVIAAPDAWEEATRIVLAALFQDPPQNAAVTRERRQIVAELRGRAANPADAATREMDRAFFGAAHPWGRPTVGTSQSLERVDFADVQGFLRDHFTLDRAFAAVVGPVEESQARRHLLSMMGTTFPSPVEVVPHTPVSRPVFREYNSITTWVSASFRIPENADHEALRMVTHLAADDLSFSPAQRSVYNVWTDVVHRIGGGEIRLQVVIPPEESDLWSGRVQAAINTLENRTLPDDVFEGHLRRFYGERLMTLISPEARAHEAARRLYAGGSVAGLIPDFEGMTQARVRAAARSLDAPTVVLLGPLLED
jgi:predicted Zn-dependent peptidase